jgi:hypothetical protein
MVEYDENKKYAYFNNMKFTRDEITGYYLSSKATKNNKRQRLHVYVWEYYKGEVPLGYEVHHKDENKNNNEPDNFEILISIKHRKLHANEIKYDDKRLEKMKIILREKAQPKAKEWHASQDGRDWHKRHYYEMKDKLYIKVKTICNVCSKEFLSPGRETDKFCSNKCKSAFRRKSGVDNEERNCVICGKIFTIGKYLKGKTCSIECGRKSRIQTMQNKKN